MNTENGPEYSPEEDAYWCGRCEERDFILKLMNDTLGLHHQGYAENQICDEHNCDDCIGQVWSAQEFFDYVKKEILKERKS